MASLRPDGTKQISLSREQYKEINTALRAFYQETKCTLIALCDISGLIIAQSGTFNPTKATLLSALAAGNYLATQEIGKLIGEKDGFKVEFHEGSEQNLYITSVDETHILTVVFTQNSTFGMVRLLAAKLTKELEATFSHDKPQELPATNVA